MYFCSVRSDANRAEDENGGGGEEGEIGILILLNCLNMAFLDSNYACQ
jgi:hypothetical protein